MKIRYQGICGKFGSAAALNTGIWLPTAINFAVGHGLNLEASPFDAKTLIFSGIAATSAAVFAHEIADIKLSGRGVGMSHGSKITKVWQVAAYAVVAAAGLGIGAAYSERDQEPSSLPASSSLQAKLVY